MLLTYLDLCVAAMRRVAPCARTREGTDRFAAALEQASPVDGAQARLLPALDRCQVLDQGDLGAGFVELAPTLPWIPTHRSDDGGTELALCPLDQLMDLGEVVAGFMYVDATRTYPLHSHPPQELYLTIAGTGRWRFGGASGLVPVAPGSVIYNHPNDLHQMVADETPVASFYVLWP